MGVQEGVEENLVGLKGEEVEEGLRDEEGTKDEGTGTERGLTSMTPTRSRSRSRSLR